MRVRVTGRALALAALGTSLLALAPLGCLFPEYTFDLSTSSTGSGGTTTTSSTSSTTTGTGGAAPVEDCLNGVDDDGDDLVDCADPACQVDHECVDPPPTGWESPGLVALYEGTFGSSPPTCPGEMSAEAYSGQKGLIQQQATCSPCDCEAPTGQSCEFVPSTVSPKSDLNPTKLGVQPVQVRNVPCGQNATQTHDVTVPDPPYGGVCFHSGEDLAGGQTCAGNPCNVSVQSGEPVVSGGTCKPSGGTPFKPKPSWSSDVLACHGTKQGGGCSDGKVCALKPKAPFRGHVCIQQKGDVACPAGAYVNKSVAHEGYSDTRDCTGCQCGPASGGKCEITISLWSDPTSSGQCSLLAGTFKAGGCFDLPAGNPAIAGITDSVSSLPNGGSCSPITTSTPFGGTSAESPTTFCCLP